ncbi:MAG: hypothetical protein ACP5LD_10860, partial [Desulfomonilaceae bacterium]
CTDAGRTRHPWAQGFTLGYEETPRRRRGSNPFSRIIAYSDGVRCPVIPTEVGIQSDSWMSDQVRHDMSSTVTVRIDYVAAMREILNIITFTQGSASVRQKYREEV